MLSVWENMEILQIVPLSHVSVGGKSFVKLQKENPDTLGKITIEQLQDEVRQAGMTVIIGKKSTEFVESELH